MEDDRPNSKKKNEKKRTKKPCHRRMNQNLHLRRHEPPGGMEGVTTVGVSGGGTTADGTLGAPAGDPNLIGLDSLILSCRASCWLALSWAIRDAIMGSTPLGAAGGGAPVVAPLGATGA